MSQANKKSGGRPPARSPQDFEEHLANNCPNVPKSIKNFHQTKISDFNESSKLTLERTNKINKACVKAFVICGISWRVITCDGWTNLSNESIWGFLIYTPDHCKYLWSLKDLLAQSHTTSLIAEELEKIIEIIENPSVWWFSLEDNFSKNEAYLVQLALKLFSVIPHTARVECVWSRLGWIYGTRWNRLGLHKIENMQKLAFYYNSHAKQELPYYSIKKTSNEVYKILMNENLDVDKNFIEITEDSLNDKNDENEIFDKENNLSIIIDLDELEFSMDEEYNNKENYSEVEAISNLTQEAQENVNWDPIAEIDKI
ncbi:40881_t:CDS:2, partial [Gigaspora margarita]